MTTWKGAESAKAQGEAAPTNEAAPAAPTDSPAPPSFATDFYRARPVRDRRIYITGVGNVGALIAHALRGIANPPPVTLIFSRPERLQQWNESSRQLTLVTEGDSETRDGYTAELAIPPRRYHGKEVDPVTGDIKEGSKSTRTEASQPLEGESNDPIGSLIICSKAPYVLQGLSAVKHRLHKDSVILFLQNGMGTIEEVNREIFPDPAKRPYYMLGINSHGVYPSPDAAFSTVHAGLGTIALGIMPHERDRNPNAPYLPSPKFKPSKDGPVTQESTSDLNLNPGYPQPSSASVYWASTQRYLLRTLLRTPVLGAAGYSPPDLLQLQLDKLAVNCIVNPLTVMLDARNGAILNNYALTRTMRLLLSEISLVIRSLPELQYIPNIEQRFDPGRLETVVVSIAHKTRNNISSMLADVRAGKRSEIDYINGWIVRRGEELGLKCLMNYMLMQMVKGKGQMIQFELREEVPIVEDKTESEDGLRIKSNQAEAALDDRSRVHSRSQR